MPEICGMVQQNPKRKLIIKLPEVLQAKQRAVANYRKERDLKRKSPNFDNIEGRIIGVISEYLQKVLFINSFT